MMKTYKLMIAIIVLFFVAGILLTPAPSQAGLDPCRRTCSTVVCGDACYPPPTTVPPIKLYRCYTYAAYLPCEGLYTCGCEFIGCSNTGAECGLGG
jgi:hypothetical protein